MTKRVFLIHGLEGNPHNHWFPWLSLELMARGFEVNAPQMPHAGEPKVKEWLGFIRNYVGRPDTETYFVGHSLGCIAVARYLAELPPKSRVGGAVFVGGFSGNIGLPQIAEFYSLPFDSEKAKAHCGAFTMIFSDNDPRVSMERSLEFARQLGAKTILERGKGHFRTADNVTALPSVLSALQKMAEGRR